ncbi:hypothetical protein Bca4012_043530 [Brassica carinata]|uniref:DUF1985 domain-containing protein n=2 Tax=Brassica TaxID=3705 RepID=A0A0D3E854_BRAOL|nr:unnamed protein product [Brassica napus]
MRGLEMEPSSGGEAIRLLVHQKIIQFRITSHNSVYLAYFLAFELVGFAVVLSSNSAYFWWTIGFSRCGDRSGAWRAANRLILYRYGVGSGENGDVGASADKIEGRKKETTHLPKINVSDSDAGEAGSEMESTAEGSSPVEPQGGDVGSSASQFPSRLFAANSYPTALRLNIYSKANVIGAVAACLQELYKLIGSLLCRQLIAIRKFELWFTFGRHPLRFSLDEFHVVTDLNCGSFDVEDSDADEAPALVDGVVCCNNKTLKLTPRYVEMLGDIETFLPYPWGRESFLATLPRFLPPSVSKVIKDTVEAMRVWLSQQTTACYGFPPAIQLFAFEALPQLLCKIPDGARTATFLDDPTACKDTVTILSVHDIFVVEADAAVSSFSLDRR